MPQLKVKDNGVWVDIPAGGVGVPSGGSTDQYLKKSSSTDYATEWADLPTNYIIMKISGTWTIPKNGGLVYVVIPDVPDDYVPVSCSLELTSSVQYGAWVTVYNPTRYYEASATIPRGWMTRLRNNDGGNTITITGIVRVLCMRETS